MKKVDYGQWLTVLISFGIVYVALFPQIADARSAIVRGALELWAIALGMVMKSAGPIAVIGSGVFARNNKEFLVLAIIVAAVGGVFSANQWFGWPFVDVPVWDIDYWGNPTYTIEEGGGFSFIRLLGSLLLAGFGAVIAFFIAESD